MWALQTRRQKRDLRDVRIDKLLNSEQIIHLRNFEFTWSDISALCGVSRMTLWKKRSDSEIFKCPKYSHISDINLEFVIRESSWCRRTNADWPFEIMWNKPALDYYHVPVDESYGIEINNTDNPEISQVETPLLPVFPEVVILQFSSISGVART